MIEKDTDLITCALDIETKLISLLDELLKIELARV